MVSKGREFKLVQLHPSLENELSRFVEMEQSQDNRSFILANSMSHHIEKYANADTHYLSIYDKDELVGFIILIVDEQHCSVEFQRILIATKGLGIGQQAIQAMEKYCIDSFGCKRIWLDVFEENHRGIHIYKKLGYLEFERSFYEKRTLILMEKLLC